MSRLLVVDIGNTTTRVGVWDGREAVDSGSRRPPSWWPAASPRPIMTRAGETGGAVEGIALSSVVPAAEAPWEEWAFGRKLELFDIQGDTPAPVTSRYGRPRQLGVDRLCAAVGAVGRLGTPVIVVMLGTATVVDPVNARHEYLGGAIAARVETGLKALHKNGRPSPGGYRSAALHNRPRIRRRACCRARCWGRRGWWRGWCDGFRRPWERRLRSR